MYFALSSLSCLLMLSPLQTPNLAFLLTTHLNPAKYFLWNLLRQMTLSQYYQFCLCYRWLLRGLLPPALPRRGTFSPPKTLFLHHLGIQTQRGMSQALLHLPPTPNHTILFLCHLLLWIMLVLSWLKWLICSWSFSPALSMICGSCHEAISIYVPHLARGCSHII